MTQIKYVTVRLPRPVIDKIDAMIQAMGGEYSSRAEFVKDAVRRLIEEKKKETKIMSITEPRGAHLGPYNQQEVSMDG